MYGHTLTMRNAGGEKARDEKKMNNENAERTQKDRNTLTHQ
jgi:hypothetical protein